MYDVREKYSISCFLCDTELSQSRDNVVKSQTQAAPLCGFLQQYYPLTEIIRHKRFYVLITR